MTWPQNDYFNAYRVYSGGSEAPELFHKWVALALASSAIGRRCWMNLAYLSIYPNVYFVLVGPPATMKSTAMTIGTRLLRAVDVPPKFSGDSVTRERLIMDLAESQVVDQMHLMPSGEYYTHSSFTIQCSELEIFLRQKDRDMVKFLTDLFDCPLDWSYKTKTQGENTILAPCVTLLAGATPQDIPEIFDEASIGTGLTSRMLFIFAPRPGKPVPLPEFTPEQLVAQDKLKWFLGEMPKRLFGEVKLDPAAKAFYVDWYLARERTHADQRIAGYWSRKHVHMMKVAMLLAITDLRTTICTKDIQDALAMLGEIEPGLLQTFASVGANKGVIVLESVVATLHALAASGQGLTYQQILHDHLHTLNQRGILETLESGVAAGRLISNRENVAGQAHLVYRLGPTERKEKTLHE